MTNPILIVSRLILALASLSTEGVGAYYTKPGLMQDVCERRVANGWMPAGVELDCEWPCLVSAIEQDHIGEWWLVNVPGASLHY